MERNFEAVWQMIRKRPFGWRLDWAESGMAVFGQQEAKADVRRARVKRQSSTDCVEKPPEEV
jgi:hypothetical protein